MSLGEAYVSIKVDLTPLTNSLVIAQQKSLVAITAIQKSFNQLTLSPKVNMRSNLLLPFKNSLETIRGLTVRTTKRIQDDFENIKFAPKVNMNPTLLLPYHKAIKDAEVKTKSAAVNIQNSFNKININKINNDFRTYNNNVKKAEKTTVASAGMMESAISRVYYAWRTASFAVRAVTDSLKWLFNPMVQFEDQLATVSTMLDKTTMFHMKGFSVGLRSLSKEFGLATTDLSMSLKEILSSSFAPAEALGILEVGAKSGVAGMSTTQKAAEVLTGILNSYGLGAEYAMEISDAMFMTIKRGRITFEQMSETIGQVASGAASAGISFNELSAAISILTRKGVPYSRTMTSLNALVRAFLKNTQGSRDMAAKFGLELSTNTLKTEGLAGVLKKLNMATDEQLAKIFPNIRSMRAIIGLVRDRTKFTEELAFWNNKAGKTEEALSKKMDTASRKIKIFNQHTKDLRVSLQGLLPLLNDQVQNMTRLANSAIEGKFLENIAANFEVASNKLGVSIKVVGVYISTGFQWAYGQIKYYLNKSIEFMKLWSKRAIIAISPRGLIDSAAEKLGMFGGELFKLFGKTLDGFKKDVESKPKKIEAPLSLGLLIDLNQTEISKIWSDYDEILSKTQDKFKKKKDDLFGLSIVPFQEMNLGMLTVTAKKIGETIFGEIESVGKKTKFEFPELDSGVKVKKRQITPILNLEDYRTEWGKAVDITTEKFNTMETLFVEFNSSVTSGWANTIEEFMTGSGDIFERMGNMVKSFIQTVADALNQLMAKKAAQWFFSLMFDQGGMFSEFGNLFGGNEKTSIKDASGGGSMSIKTPPLRKPMQDNGIKKMTFGAERQQIPAAFSIKIENKGTPQEVSSSNFDLEKMTLGIVTKNLVTNPSFAGAVRNA